MPTKYQISRQSFFLTLTSFILISVVTVVLLGPSTAATEQTNKINVCKNSEIVATQIDPMMKEVDASLLPTKLYTYSGDRDIIKLPSNISVKQADLLRYAYSVAKADGHREPAVLQGIIWQESHAGGYPKFRVGGQEFGLKFGERYYGVGQLKLSAARDVLKRFPKEFPIFSTNDELMAQLIMDDKFNIRVASKYLWMVGRNEQKNYKRPTNFMITAYNKGVQGARKVNYDRWHYTVSVNKYRKTFLRDFNKLYVKRPD